MSLTPRVCCSVILRCERIEPSQVGLGRLAHVNSDVRVNPTSVGDGPAVATSGIIGWVGLVVPHLARALVGPDFPKLIPTAALLGGGYLLFIDTLARTAAPVEIPLGILTAVIGTPFFIWLLAGMQRTWS